MRGCAGGSAPLAPCFCAVGVQGVLWCWVLGDVSCPSGWRDSPGQGHQASRDAVSRGDLGVAGYEPALSLGWKQTVSSEVARGTRTKRCGCAVLCVWKSCCTGVSGGPTEDVLIDRAQTWGSCSLFSGWRWCGGWLCMGRCSAAWARGAVWDSPSAASEVFPGCVGLC